MPTPTQSLGGVLTDTTLAQIAQLSNSIFQTQGNTYFVNPLNGFDGNPGTNAQPLRTVSRALSLCTPGQNDIVLLQASSNTASQTTDYQSALLTWNKDLTHLVGVNCGPLFSQRSRIAFASTYNAATDLFQLSANGCLISGVEFFAGVAGTLPTGCMTVSGIRNVIRKCHIAGMGNAANDISGAYSLMNIEVMCCKWFGGANKHVQRITQFRDAGAQGFM